MPISSAIQSGPVPAILQAAAGFAWSATLGNGVGRWADQQANFLTPNVLPPVDGLIRAFHGGFILPERFREVMRLHGIATSADLGANDQLGAAWIQFIRSQRPRFDPAYTRDLQRMGLLAEADILASLRHAGINSPELVNAFLTEKAKLSPDAAMSLWARGIINTEDMVRILRQHGFAEDAIVSMMRAAPNYPSLEVSASMLNRSIMSLESFRENLRIIGYRADDIDEMVKAATQPVPLPAAIEMRNRGYIGPNEFVEMVKDAGFSNPTTRQRIMDISRGIPTYSDMQLMIRREAFDDQIVERFGYDDEYRDVYEQLLAATGVVGKPTDTIANMPQEMGIPWAKALYRTRWNLPSPTQAYTMLQRLRGDPLDPATWRVPGVAPMTSADLSELLRVNDYPRFFRDKLQAISYKTLRLVDIRGLQEFEVENRQEIEERYQDNGYTAEDANTVYRLNREKIRDKRRRYLKNIYQASMAKVVRQVMQQYDLGVVTPQELKNNLISVGYNDNESDVMVNNTLINEQVTMQAAFVKQLRSDWLDGNVSSDEARVRLLNAGWTVPAAAKVVAKFEMVRTTQRRYLKTREVMQFAKDGFMDRAELVRRLSNMGWAEVDLLLYLADYDTDQAAKIAAQRGEAIKARTARTLGELKKVKATLAYIEKDRARLRRDLPVGEVKLMYANNEIGDIEVIDILQSQGYTDQAVLQYLQEAETDRMNLNGACNDDAPEDYGDGKATENKPGAEREGKTAEADSAT